MPRAAPVRKATPGNLSRTLLACKGSALQHVLDACNYNTCEKIRAPRAREMEYLEFCQNANRLRVLQQLCPLPGQDCEMLYNVTEMCRALRPCARQSNSDAASMQRQCPAAGIEHMQLPTHARRHTPRAMEYLATHSQFCRHAMVICPSVFSGFCENPASCLCKTMNYAVAEMCRVLRPCPRQLQKCVSDAASMQGQCFAACLGHMQLQYMRPARARDGSIWKSASTPR